MKLSVKPADTAKHILLFGPPKSGKSYLAGLAAEKFNLYWFDLERGIDTLKQLPIEWQEKIEVITLPDTRSFPIAIQTMLRVIKGGKFRICESHGVIDCAACKKVEGAEFILLDTTTFGPDDALVVDSLTQLTQSAIAHITKNQPEDYKLDYDDWGNLGKLMDTFLSHVQNAPFHVICISHETEVEMEDGKLKLVPTAGTRAFSRNTAKYFGEVIYCEVKNKKHQAASSTLYSGNILTGSRTGAILEMEGKASLIPILEGKVVPRTAPEVGAGVPGNSPGQLALGGLKKLSLGGMK